MTLEKMSIPQIHIVDLEADAPVLTLDDITHHIASRRKSDGRLGTWKAAMIVLISVMATCTTMLMVIPQTRHVIVHQEVLGHSMHSLATRAVAAKSNSKATTTSKAASMSKTILLPLYMYPGDQAINWLPAINAAKKYPNQQFIMVINPNNGPGSATVDPNVKLGLQAFSKLPNVKLIGYVHQSYGARAQGLIQSDLNLWATWKNSNMYGVPITGIFYDEMPDDAETIKKVKQAHVKYVAKTNTMARANPDFTFIVQNPGVVPDNAYFGLTGNQAMDATIVLENSYDAYTEDPSQLDLGVDPSKLSVVVYSVPTDSLNSVASYQAAVQPMLSKAKHIFMTDLSVDFYENWGTYWNTFVQAISACS